mmetsp:Transcript_148061/g.369111  ORF Transcript_148061/g.369111 Transcript_148061/m.369111 type:complete len:331 (-) Transcript_148061:345-1337(-)
MAVVGPAVWALLAMLCWALNNFLLSVVAKEASSPADAGLSGTFVLWVSTMACGIPLFAWQAATSGLFKGIHGKWNAAGAFGAGLMSALGMLNLTLALASDPNSAGPITAVLPLNGLLVCLLAWAVLGEKLTRLQMLGIAVAVAGPMMMALADRSGSGLKGVLLGGISASLLGASNFLRRLVMTRGAKNPMDVQLLVWLALGSCGVVSVVCTYMSGRGLKGLDSARLITIAASSGCIWAMGSCCFQLALRGPAGPATAIANSNGAGVLLLQMACYHPHIPAMKLCGMGLCMLGAAVIALSPKSVRVARQQQHPLESEGAFAAEAGLVVDST